MGCSGSSAPLISIFLPTRGRSELARAFLDSLAQTALEPGKVEVVIYVDEDDTTSAGLTESRLRVTTLVGQTATMGAINAACLHRAAGDIVMLANDDVLVRTAGWDAELRAVHARFPDGIYLAWPNDRFASHRMSTFPILSRTACGLLVEPFSPEYASAFIDYDLFDIFTRLRRLGHDRLVYLQHVVFEHRHHRTGKRIADDTTRRHPRFGDDMTFLGRRDMRQHQAERLAVAIDGGVVPKRAIAAHIAPTHNTGAALVRFASGFLADRGLPLGRRVYLFFWFCGRYLAARLHP